jgi:hypothetical protein
VNPGQIQKISDCDIKDKPWCTLGPPCGPRAGVLLPTDNPSIHPQQTQIQIEKNFNVFVLLNLFILPHLENSSCKLKITDFYYLH